MHLYAQMLVYHDMPVNQTTISNSSRTNSALFRVCNYIDTTNRCRVSCLRITCPICIIKFQKMQILRQRVKSGDKSTRYSAIAVLFFSMIYAHSQLYGILLAACSILIKKSKFIGQQEIASPC